MSAKEMLAQELARQPDSIAQRLLEYLHALSPESVSGGSLPRPVASGHFASHWRQFYGAFDGESWEEPKELPNEKREDW